MNLAQIEDVLSKLVPLTLELSGRIVELQEAIGLSREENQHIPLGNIKAISAMCDELLEAFRSSER